MNRKLNMGMVGGGRGAFIGAVHRRAAQLDERIELVCGAFSSTPEKSKASGRDLFLPDSRVYGSWKDMFQKERRLPEGERMDFVCIVTPNSTHFPVAMAALEAGFHVVCDKPMTLTVAQAKILKRQVQKTGLLFCLTHNYTGYPMVKEARALVLSGQLGKIRRVVAEYPQGWLATPLEGSGQKQAAWRTNPKLAGAACCMGDIGVHAANLAEYIAGAQITEVCAELNSFVKGRKMDDDGNVLLRLSNGARGVLWASQIAVGVENGPNIRVYGEKGGIEWQQLEPNSLVVRWLDRPFEVRRTGTGFVGPQAAEASRIPPGHPEGYQEAFAVLYKHFAAALALRLAGKKVDESKMDYPTVSVGVSGMAFIEAVVKSSKQKQTWVKLDV